MSWIVLRLLGVLGVVSGMPNQGNLVQRILARIVRYACLLIFAFGATYAFAAWTNSLIDRDAVRTKIETMTEAVFTSLAEELGGELTLSLISGEQNRALAVHVSISSAPTKAPAASEMLCGQAIDESTLCLFRVDSVLSPTVDKLEEIFGFSKTVSDWGVFQPFEEMKFPTTAYSISERALEIARENPDITFTRSKEDQLRAAIEGLMEDRALFLPNDRTILLARQLNGPIQFTVFCLGFFAIAIILFAFLGSVLPNAVLHSYDKVTLSEVYIHEGPQQSTRDGDKAHESPAAPAVLASNGDEYLAISDIGEEAVIASEEPTPDVDIPIDEEVTQIGDKPNETNQNDVEIFDTFYIQSATPWSKKFDIDPSVDLTDEHQIANYYERVADYFRDQSRIFGTPIDPPILRLRTAATRAIANTGDTSMLPSFLDTQRDSFDNYFNARLTAVRYLLWVIPTIGFIGTIIGVSNALSATISLQAARDLTAAAAQSTVTSSMGMAFDTTLIALVVAVIVMLLYFALQGAEESMIVLERNRAEDEVLKISKFVRKPGGPIDLAQQLIALGVNTEVLVRDLKLFEKTGPELTRTIEMLQLRELELTEIIEKRRSHGVRSGSLGWLWAAIGLLLIYVLGVNGVLGSDVLGLLRFD